MKKQQSDFGKGCVYCLGLFLSHNAKDIALRIQYKDNKIVHDCMIKNWFNAASDHLYELQPLPDLSRKLKKDIESFKKRVIDKGHGTLWFSGFLTEQDIIDECEVARSLLFRIDKELGSKPVEAVWK